MARSGERQRALVPDPHIGLLGPLGEEGGLRSRRMFGCWAYYLADRLVWVSAARRQPWNGILVPTERLHHAALRASVPGLRVHPVLGKWLYLSARHPQFECHADVVAQRIVAGDPRIGVCASAPVPPTRRRSCRRRAP